MGAARISWVPAETSSGAQAIGCYESWKEVHGGDCSSVGWVANASNWMFMALHQKCWMFANSDGVDAVHPDARTRSR